MDLETTIEYYKDNLGRMDLKPVNGGEASTNNQLLYTGELAILQRLIGNFQSSDFDSLRKAISSCQVDNYPGLYSRHPVPYRFKQKDGKPNFVPVSFDEITGACFTNWCAGDLKSNEHIVEHAQMTNNRFCDVPGYELIDSSASVFKAGFWKDLKAYFTEARSYEKLETGLRKAVRNHPRFYPIFFKHSVTNFVIYLSGIGRKCSFIQSVAFFLAAFLASVKKDNTSTKVLWWFRFRFLELTETETFLTKLAKQFYNYTNNNRLGESWEVELFKAYYPENHPFHRILKDVQSRR
jgi:hypothetical protein